MTHPTLNPEAAAGVRGSERSVTGVVEAGNLTIEDPSAVVNAANQMQESGQRLEALHKQVELARIADQSLPGTDTARACERLDRDVKNILQQQGKWPVAVAAQIREAVRLLTHQDSANADSINHVIAR